MAGDYKPCQQLGCSLLAKPSTPWHPMRKPLFFFISCNSLEAAVLVIALLQLSRLGLTRGCRSLWIAPTDLIHFIDPYYGQNPKCFSNENTLEQSHAPMSSGWMRGHLAIRGQLPKPTTLLEKPSIQFFSNRPCFLVPPWIWIMPLST